MRIHGLTLLTFALSISLQSVSARAASKPNVLVIVTDDLRDELGCYGAKHIASPQIDSLAKQGTRFTHAYCQYALCGPSRASFFSGCRPETIKVFGNKVHFRQAQPDIVSFPQLFKNHGYFTRGFGKVLHNNTDDPIAWSEPFYFVHTHQYASPEHADAQVGIDGIHAGNKELPLFEAADVPDNAYRDGLIAEEAVSTLKRVAGAERPFMLMVGFHKPHTPFNAPKRYWDRYSREQIELAPNPFAPQGAPPFALSTWQYVRSFQGMPAEGSMPDELAREIKHAYFACISYIDAQIGRLLQTLDECGVRQQTVIVFFSDHGYQLGEHGMWCKHTNFETSTKVPLIVVDPRQATHVPAVETPVELVDVYPTVAELCGLPLPAHLDGESFARLLSDRQAGGEKAAAYSQFHRAGYQGRSIRTERFRYTEWRQAKTGKIAGRELYDHANDPLENTNVIGDPRFAADIASLARRLQSQFAAGERP